MSLKIGMKEAIVVSSFEDIESLLCREECSGRVLEDFISSRSFGEELGVIFSNGELWKELRRFTIRNLRDFGFGKKSTLESVLEHELEQFSEKLKQDAAKNEGTVEVDFYFNLSLLNVLWGMVSGKTFSYDDHKLNHLVQLNGRIMQLGNHGGDISIAFPLLAKLFPFLTNTKEFQKGFKEIHAFLYDVIVEHKSRSDYVERPESFVDVFLSKIDEIKKTNPNQEFFTEKNLIVILMDLFQTGPETVNGTLCYALLFMILHPKVQKKIQKEIDQVVGKNNQILLEHKNRLPYTQATILEIYRCGFTIPIIPPRKVKQFTYKGYNFPKDMTIVPNIYSVFMDKKYWTNPETFQPERFIDSNGKIYNTKKLTPFGFGKRICMAEAQADTMIFFYFTTLLQKFEFSKILGAPDPTTVALPAFSLAPQEFKMKVQVR